MKIYNTISRLLCLPLLSRQAAALPTNASLPNLPQPQAGLMAHSAIDGMNTDGYAVRAYTWRDSSGLARSVSLVHSDRKDPAGFYGGYMRNYNYTVGGVSRNCTSSDPDHPGFGFLVNHYIDNGSYPSESSRFHPSTSESTYLNGRHHSIHEYTYNYALGDQPMAATIQWLFKSGHDHPIIAITQDASAAAPNKLMADFRSPYGDFEFDGGNDSIVAGVGWGDHYKFITGNQSTLTMASGWHYDVPNTVPYVQLFTLKPDAEMGLIQTQTYLQHDLGGYDGYHFWNKSAPNGPMPPAESWPFQLNQYSLPYTNTSKRIALGSNYGALGQESYPSYGEDRMLSGVMQSFSVHMALGTHSAGSVAQQVAAVEAVQQATLVAGPGVEVRTAMPAGIGRSDINPLGGPSGYNPAYATWELIAAANVTQMNLSLLTDNSTLHNPTFVVHNWPSARPPKAVVNDGAPLVADSLQGYLASVDVARQTLWLTIGADVSAQKPLVLAISAPEPDVGHKGAHWSKVAVGLSASGAVIGAAGGIYAAVHAIQKIRQPRILGT
jgi:hypothetical protein